MSWAFVNNRKLLTLIEEDGFNALMSNNKRMEFD